MSEDTEAGRKPLVLTKYDIWYSEDGDRHYADDPAHPENKWCPTVVEVEQLRKRMSEPMLAAELLHHTILAGLEGGVVKDRHTGELRPIGAEAFGPRTLAVSQWDTMRRFATLPDCFTDSF